MFSEQRYGCWCGPGHVCEEVQDDIDKCCKAHDLAYDAVGVTSESPAPSGMAGMWSIEGFRRTMAADAKLVAGVNGTIFDFNFYGPAAAAYRAGVTLIFGPRALIGAAANLIAAIGSIPTEWLTVDLTDINFMAQDDSDEAGVSDGGDGGVSDSNDSDGGNLNNNDE